MKFNRTTISLVILALGLTSFVYFSEIKDQGFDITSKIDRVEDTREKIFSFDSKDIKSITINLDFDREPKLMSFEKTKKGTWEMIQPEKLTASDAAMAFLINLFNQAQNTVEIPSTENTREEYGLDTSNYKIQWTLDNGDKYEMILGKSNFDDTQIYAEVIFPDSVETTQNIFLVSKSFQYAIERDFDEWTINQE
ncbi:DUF4340 domain-containing protein [Geminocystis sp. CENA526]|uniref:DUF4340 domain-containing protein n=1 Tax=Geminocystis sp. CENA526 TaxID=1355871 RepID=UPI003D6F0779